MNAWGSIEGLRRTMVLMAAQSAYVSASDYLESEETSEERHEYFDGTVYAMAGGSQNHEVVIGNLFFRCRLATEERNCMVLSQGVKVAIPSRKGFFYPDVSISCPPNFVDRRKGIIDNPTCLFEVLSPSTQTLDRGPKFVYYQRLESLRNYVLIETDSAFMRVFSLEDGEWKFRDFEGLDASAEIASVGIKLNLNELYENVEFGEE